MKVLAVCTPGPGHVNPLLPLIKALLAQGDQVTVAADAAAADAVERAGAELCPAGHGEMDWFDELRRRVRGFPGDGLPPERINHYFVPRLFAEIATADMIDDVVACGRRFDPDLVLFETYAFAGPLVADVLGVPSAHHLLGPMLEHGVLELANDAVSPLWRSFERTAPGHAGVYRDVTVAICPASLEPIDVPSGERLLLRPVAAVQPAAQRPGRPLVYVTLGTSFNANLDVFRTALTALADEPLDVVVTVGVDQDPAALAPVPANARVERFIPQAELLPTCAVVVHHAGSGTTLGSLAHGLPQVAIPQGADNFVNAAMLERAEVARVLRPGQVTATAVRDAVRDVLAEPRYARAARRAAEEIAAMPAAEEVAASLRSRDRSGRRR